MILFLDFDGVLHPVPSTDTGMFCRAPILWNLMRARHGSERCVFDFMA